MSATRPANLPPLGWALLIALLVAGASPASAGAPEAAPPSPPEVLTPAPLAAAVEAFNAGARFPLPALSPAQLERLLAGKVLKIREVPDDPDAAQRAIGLLLTDTPAADLWLSLRDVHFTAVDELTEVRLTPDGQWPAVWYQHLDLPRPFSDRQWVVDVTDTHTLAAATSGQAWEHAWVLNPDGPAVAAAAVAQGRIAGIDSEQASDCIYTPTNHGAWLVLSLPDGRSVLGYHVTSVIGGSVPDKFVADYTLFTLGRLLRGVVERTPQVLAHYDALHEPIEGGDGVPLAPRPAGAP